MTSPAVPRDRATLPLPARREAWARVWDALLLAEPSSGASDDAAPPQEGGIEPSVVGPDPRAEAAA